MSNKTFETIAVKLHSQDNRCTSHPMFVVRQVRRIYGMAASHAEKTAWIDADGYEADAKTAESLDKMWKPEEDSGYTKVWYTDIFEFVTCCFTNDAAEAYIANNRINLNNPHVYVASGYRNQEWIDMRSALMELPVKVPD